MVGGTTLCVDFTPVIGNRRIKMCLLFASNREVLTSCFRKIEYRMTCAVICDRRGDVFCVKKE